MPQLLIIQPCLEAISRLYETMRSQSASNTTLESPVTRPCMIEALIIITSVQLAYSVNPPTIPGTNVPSYHSQHRVQCYR